MAIKQRHYSHFLITVIFLCLSTAISADSIYKWQDENGKWHFSDKAPDNPAAAVEEAPLNSINSTATAKTNAELKEVFTEESKEEIEHRQQKQAAEDKRQAQLERWCQQQRRRLSTMEGRVAFLDSNGKVMAVSEQERIARAAALKNKIAKTCR